MYIIKCTEMRMYAYGTMQVYATILLLGKYMAVRGSIYVYLSFELMMIESRIESQFKKKKERLTVLSYMFNDIETYWSSAS